ncbi:MAG: zinc ribbon domain-containing protein [Coriobacteriales bacterium]|nr:zinc ribbon domain-containing protein [Coriobacteriales bacterium]
MFCPKCGTQVADGGAFCPACGTAIVIGTAAAGIAAAAAAPPAEATATPVVVKTNEGAKDGINKCPACGSSDIALNLATGLLRCNFCRKEFSSEADTLDYDISRLQGVIIGSGSDTIVADAATMITLKCTACGAEVVIDTAESAQARCHWCRNTLSINQQIPNGAIPDALIPFRLTKEQAQKHIEAFVSKRQFFAHPRFKAEFTTQNIMGVYLPYMVIDVNAHADLRGQGEHLVRKYTVGSGDNKKTYYDADLYNLGRDFDLHIDDLTVEASNERINQVAGVNTNNVINAILPYPLKETVKFNANYLRGFTSEKRDINREQLAPLAGAQVRDIARHQAKQTALFYDRGIHWDQVQVENKGELWKSVYLPVWLYSYLEVKGNGKKLLHYVAVNGVTGETMGSVPLNTAKLFIVSAIVEAVGLVLGVGATILLLFAS